MQKEKKSTHMTEKRNKHMTLEDRIEIQTCLRSGMTFKAIARRICKDPTTVSREVKAYLKKLRKISIHAPLAGCDSKNVQRKLHFF